MIEDCAIAVAHVLVALVRAGHMKRVTTLDISCAVHDLRVGPHKMPIKVAWARQAIETRAWSRIQKMLGAQ